MSYSEQIEQRYALQLSPDLRAWFDDRVWDDAGGAVFRHPLTPDELLDPPAGIVWAGFMLPDTIPLIGNRYGDWLCLRVGAAGEVCEVICWNHGGGDWIPCGRNLAEALLHDAACHAKGSRSAEFVDEDVPRESLHMSARWARQWLDVPAETLDELLNVDGNTPEQSLLEAGVSVVAVRRDRILACLNSRLKSCSDSALARELGIAWEPDYVSWLFDTDLVPGERRAVFEERFGIPYQQLTHQDWATAELEALEVCQARKDLGWPFDIAGWAAERRGDVQAAIQHYAAGARTSMFADDTVNFRSHWFDLGYGKFATARLAALHDKLPRDLRADPYLSLFWVNDPDSLRERVLSFWLEQAKDAERQQRPQDAYRCYYNAGWDCGLSDVRGYIDIFQGLIRNANAAGCQAWAQVAALHQRFLLA